MTSTVKSWGVLATTSITDGGGGFNDAILDFFWTFDTSFGSTPHTVAGTFSNGTTPGDWLSGIGGATMGLLTSGPWQVTISATVTHIGSTVSVTVQIEQNFDLASRIEIFNETMADGASLPLFYSGTFDFGGTTGSIGLPVMHSLGVPVQTNVLGTATFTPL